MLRWSYAYRSALIVLTVLLFAGCPQTTPDPQPEANFSASPRSGNTGVVVSFSDASTTVSGEPIQSRQWNFGDGGRSVEPNPTHTYLIPGDFTVSLTVTSSGGSHTRTRTGYIRINSPSGSAQLDSDGGTVSANGTTITVPAGALTARVDFGITRVTQEIPLNTSETTFRVGDTFRITHNSASSLGSSSDSEPVAPAVLSIPYREDAIATGDRVPAKVHIVAQLASGEVIPILGSITSGNVQAEVTDLPASALYTVVYRPEAYLASISVTAKAPTTSTWNGTWQVALSPSLLTQLTALRLGTALTASSYFKTEFTSAQLEATQEQLLDGLLAVQDTFESVRSRSPRLVSLNGTSTLLCFNTLSLYTTAIGSLDSVFYAGSPFGSIVIDPQQLLMISAWNADRFRANPDNVDIAQKLAANQAASEVLARSVVDGYDITESNATSPADGAVVSFEAGIKEGLALYVGQMSGGLSVNRSQLDGDRALLSTPVFAPFDGQVAGYAAASQDFYRYVENRHSPASPLEYIASGSGVVKGMLEGTRTALANSVSPSIAEATALAATAIDRAFVSYLGESIGQTYYNYAIDLAFEHGPEGVLRTSDSSLLPLTFDATRFSETAVMTGSIETPNGGLDFPRIGDTGLTLVPPLTSRAIVIEADPAATSLHLTFNRSQWAVDSRDQTIEAVVYRDGLPGVRLGANASSLTFSGFEADAGQTKAIFYVILVNTSVSTSNSVTVVVESLAAN